MDYVENNKFDEIKVGDSASLVRTLTPEDVKLFAVMSGNVNPTHVDEEYARSDIFHRILRFGLSAGLARGSAYSDCRGLYFSGQIHRPNREPNADWR